MWRAAERVRILKFRIWVEIYAAFRETQAIKIIDREVAIRTRGLLEDMAPTIPNTLGVGEIKKKPGNFQFSKTRLATKETWKI